MRSVTGIEAAKLYTDLFDQAEVRELAEKHGATTILVFDRTGNIGVTFERVAAGLSRTLPSHPA